MKKNVSHLRLTAVVLLSLYLLPSSAHPQGTFQWSVTFDGNPPIEPSDSIALTYYTELGMRFTPIGLNERFGRSGGAEVNEGFPRNGSAYIYAAFGGTLAVSSVNGGRFGLVSVDLAEFSTLYQVPLTVRFVGFKPDGSTVLTDFVTDGIIDGAGPVSDFETFYFDSRFWDVLRVEVPTYRWSLDNMVFSNVVPEPRMGALLGLGGAALLAVLVHRKLRAKS